MFLIFHVVFVIVLSRRVVGIVIDMRKWYLDLWIGKFQFIKKALGYVLS